MSVRHSVDISAYVRELDVSSSDEEAPGESRVLLVETSERLVSDERTKAGDVVVAVMGSGKTLQLLKVLRNALAHEASFRELATRAEIDPDDLIELLTRQFSGAPTALSSEEAFSPGELDALHGANVDLSPPETGPAVQLATTARYVSLLQRSLSVADAASRIRVSPGRIRQRIADGSLYSVRTQPRGEWRLPPWQFTEDGLLPGLESVLKGLPRTMHPLAVEHLMTSRTPDLDVADRRQSPVEWLASGGDPGVVAQLLEAMPAAP